MAATQTIFLLLFLVGMSGILARFLRWLPLPLAQVGIGAFAASPAIGLRVSLEPELFMLVFVPPLLFADGWRVPKREFFSLRGPILALALGLVVFTVLGTGYFVHWAIPAIPLSAAFALGAVLSPTDAVAVSAVSGRLQVPARLMHILEGEALLNDASGLVAMKFAIAATLTGTFSFGEAVRSFFIIAAGGLTVGFSVAWVLSWVHQRLANRRAQRPVAHVVLLLLLMPFAVYLVAEHFGFSGILAAVAAGMTINFTDLQRTGDLFTRMQARGVSTMIEFTFNGIIFLLLGLQLPSYFGQPLRSVTRTFGLAEAGQLLGHAAAIWLVLLVLRFVWMWCGLHLAVSRAKRRGERWNSPSLRMVGAATLGGIRGAVTLAGVLSVPLALPSGLPFPSRDLLIFLASGIILFSLLGGCFGLPVLLRGLRMPSIDPHEHEIAEGRRLAAEAAIKAIEEVRRPAVETGILPEHGGDSEAVMSAGVIDRFVTLYRQKVEAAGHGDAHQPIASLAASLEREVHLTAVRAERVELYRLRSAGHINDETLRTLVAEIDLVEASLLGSR